MNTLNTMETCLELSEILAQYGNINFLSKEDLYNLIDYIRTKFGINTFQVFNVSKFCQENFEGIIEYKFHAFKDAKIGGFLVKNQLPEKSYIIVNSSKDAINLIFDLTHEMIHFLLHPENRKYYISSSLSDIDNFEWQANEGSAELLVPYKRFIPQFVEEIKTCRTRTDYLNLLKFLSDEYIVSTAVLEYRIAGLKYEIAQFENGVPIDSLEFLSKTAQEKKKIYITSYKEKFSSNTRTLKDILAEYRVYNRSS